MGAMAEFERDLVVERTRAGLAAARATGRHPGRPPKVSPAQAHMAARLAGEGMTQQRIAETLGMTRSTVGRVLRGEVAGLPPAAEDDLTDD